MCVHGKIRSKKPYKHDMSHRHGFTYYEPSYDVRGADAHVSPTTMVKLDSAETDPRVRSTTVTTRVTAATILRVGVLTLADSRNSKAFEL